MKTHSDWDYLSDSFELSIGTDPLVEDTDFDGVDDWSEWDNPDFDPLVYEMHYSYFEIGRELVLGAFCGEWLADEHDSVYYMAGWMLSGFYGLGDIRDIGASIYRLDGLGILFNAFSLLPFLGDVKKVSATVTKFAAKNPHMIFSIAVFSVKHVDDSIGMVKSAIGKDTVEYLVKKGYSEDIIVVFYKKGLDLAKFDEILTNHKIYESSPEFALFLKTQIKGGEILSKRVTFDVKKIIAAEKAGDTRRLSGYLANIKGAYAEDLAKRDLVTDGIDVIKDISHVNAGGPDMALRSAHFDDVVETKFVQSLTVSKLKNYVIRNDITGEYVLNAKYIGMHLGGEFFTNSQNQKRFVLYLNGPQSADIMKNLKQKLPERVPFKYTSTDPKTQGQIFEGTFEIVIKAVNK